MARVKKLEQGSTIPENKIEQEILKFATDRGNINFNTANDFILRQLDTNVNNYGFDQEATRAYKDEISKQLEGIKSGKIVKLNSSGVFTNTAPSEFTDYSNWQPTVKKANWFGKNVTGQSDEIVKDVNYARNKAVNDLAKTLNQWDLYQEPKEEIIKPVRKRDYSFGAEDVYKNIEKNIFRGDEFDPNVWASYDNKTRLSNIANPIKAKLNEISNWDDVEKAKWDFSSKMGYADVDEYKEKLQKSLDLLEKGEINNDLNTAMLDIGMSGLRKLYDPNYAAGQPVESNKIETKLDADPNKIQQITNDKGETKYVRYNEQKADFENVTDQNVISDPFNPNTGSFIYDGKLYNSIDELPLDNPNYNYYKSEIEKHKKNLENKNYFDLNKGFTNKNSQYMSQPINYLLRKDVSKLGNIQWSDKKSRSLVYDESQNFDSLGGNKLYSFTDPSNKNNPNSTKHLIFDKNSGEYVELKNISNVNGTYIGESISGKKYPIGKYNKTDYSTNLLTEGGSEAPIINPKIESSTEPNTFYTNLTGDYTPSKRDEEVMLNQLNTLKNYNVPDSFVNDVLKYLPNFENLYKNGNFKIAEDQLNDEDSQLNKIFKSIVDKNKLEGVNGKYNIPLDLFLKEIGKNPADYKINIPKKDNPLLVGAKNITENLLGYGTLLGGLGALQYILPTLPEKKPVIESNKFKKAKIMKAYKKGGVIKLASGGSNLFPLGYSKLHPLNYTLNTNPVNLKNVEVLGQSNKPNILLNIPKLNLNKIIPNPNPTSTLQTPVSLTGRKPILENIDPLSLNVNPINVNTSIIPKSTNIGNVNPSVTGTHGGTVIKDITTKNKPISPTPLLDAATLAFGLSMENKAYNAAKNIRPVTIDSPTLYARTPQGNEVVNQFYKNAGLKVLNNLSKNLSSDQNYNTAAMLEGNRYMNEMAEKGALANDQEIKRTTELADRIEQQNQTNRIGTANQNRNSYIAVENMKNNLKASHLGNVWGGLINPYLNQVRGDWRQKEAMSNQLAAETMSQIPVREYQDAVADLSKNLQNGFDEWKVKNPNGTPAQFQNTAEYRILYQDTLNKKQSLQRDLQDKVNKIKSNQLSYFTKGGKMIKINKFSN